MIKINGMEITGLKKAIGDYKRYNAGGYYSPEYGRLMFDTSTGELWTDYFYSLGHNSWREYHDADIVDLGRLILNQYMVDEPVTMETVKKYIKRHYGQHEEA